VAAAVIDATGLCWHFGHNITAGLPVWSGHYKERGHVIDGNKTKVASTSKEVLSVKDGIQI
jgi:hypothetical protein